LSKEIQALDILIKGLGRIWCTLTYIVGMHNHCIFAPAEQNNALIAQLLLFRATVNPPCANI